MLICCILGVLGAVLSGTIATCIHVKSCKDYDEDYKIPNYSKSKESVTLQDEGNKDIT